MRTFEGNSCRIHFNSDMSGDVNIFDKNSSKKLAVEAQDILDFIADYVRSERISKLEHMEAKDILDAGGWRYG